MKVLKFLNSKKLLKSYAKLTGITLVNARFGNVRISGPIYLTTPDNDLRIKVMFTGLYHYGKNRYRLFDIEIPQKYKVLEESIVKFVKHNISLLADLKDGDIAMLNYKYSGLKKEIEQWQLTK